MKRFLGLMLAVAGAGLTLWGGYHIVNGKTSTRIAVTDDLAVSALAVGLTGLAVLVVGLVWARD
ncbi:MAG: hypothetical protein C0501_27950 [Isosphaera sp.]|nr:hypothetical protein [Isosphaera sp.]